MRKLGGSMASILALTMIALIAARTSGPLAAQVQVRVIEKKAGVKGQQAPAAVGPAGLGQKPPGRPKGRFYPDASSQADALLRNASAHVRDGKWAEAIDIYQKVIAQFGDTVSALPKDDPSSDPQGRVDLFVGAREYCQRRLAALPAEGRKIYRGRVDAQAGRLFKQGKENRDRDVLRKVIEQTFCSSFGDDALELLGDLMFQDGRFAESLAFYRRIYADKPGEELGLVHPDPDVDPARIAAKKLLCRAALEEISPKGDEISAFSQAFPGAKGKIAGREGRWDRIVAEAIAQDKLGPPDQFDARWPTFAGSADRSRIAPEAVDVGSIHWKVQRLETAYPARAPNLYGGVPPATHSQLPVLAYHPIVLSHEVVIADEERITAFDLEDRPENGVGTPDNFFIWKHEHVPSGTPRSARMSHGSTSFTLTASGNRIYARMGPPGAPFMGQFYGGVTAINHVVAVERSTEGKFLWKRSSAEIALPKRNANASGPPPGFEGTPVADGRNVYIGLTEWGPMTSSYVVCLDGETGATRWVRYVGDAQAAAMDGNMMVGFGGQMPKTGEMGNRLLSLDGPTIYYQTNFGVLAAIDSETGNIRWLARYPTSDHPAGTSAGPRDRDLNPAVVHEGRVFVAPDETASIFAFDAADGRLLWQTGDETRDAIHLLGVAKGHLIASGDHVYRIDARTGKVSRWPESPRGFEGFGRGVLAGESIYVPTKTEILILDQATGMPRVDHESIKLRERFGTGGGNLVIGNGYLIVAQADALVVFCTNTLLIKRYREEIARAPERALNYFLLAEAARSAGEDSIALEALDQAIRKAASADLVEGKPLATAARDELYRLLTRMGTKARSTRDWDEAAKRFAAAADLNTSDRDRLSARLRQAEAEAERGDARKAVATLQSLLADERARTLSIPVDDHRSARADLVVSERLSKLVRQAGREIYERFDREAKELLRRGLAEKDPRLLEDVGRRYPVAKVLPDSLRALARLREEEDRPADAARAYRRLSAIADDDSTRARALWGLARAFESQGLLVPARDAYARLRDRFADAKLDDRDLETLGARAARRLARPPFDRLPGDFADPDLPLPMVRTWSKTWSENARILAGEGDPPAPNAPRLFVVEQNLLRPIDPRSGESPWTADLGGTPIWVGLLGDRVIAATDSRLFAFGWDKGDIRWRFDPDAPLDPKTIAGNPFAKFEAGASKNDAAKTLGGFVAVGNRVFCRRGDRELIALDGETGQVDWSYAPAQGRIASRFLIGPKRSLLQLREPNRVVVLETDTGRSPPPVAEPATAEEWPRAPLAIDDSHAAVVADSWTVRLLDLDQNRVVWSFQDGAPQPGSPKPPNGPPRLLGDGERLLALFDGQTLIRLDAKTGARIWTRRIGVENLAERPESFAIDALHCYVVDQGVLAALDLADGAPVWRNFLNGSNGEWSLATTRRHIVVVPSADRGTDDDDATVSFYSRETGKIAERLGLPLPTGGFSLRFHPSGAVVAAAAGGWGLSVSDRDAMDEAPSDR